MAIKKGWKNVTGIEPSLESLNHANKSVKNKITHSAFESKNFEKMVPMNFRNILLNIEDSWTGFFSYILVIHW